MSEIVIILIILFLGSFLQGSSGFGFGLFSMALMPFFLSVKDSMLIVLALTLILSMTIIFKYWRFIRWKELSLLLGAALVGRTMAFFFIAAYGEADIMKKWLGLVLIGMVIYLWLKPNPEGKGWQAGSFLFTVTAGFLGGFVGGAFAVGGPFFVIYLLLRYRDKRNYNANLQASFVFLNIFSLGIHGLNGDLNQVFWLYLVSGALVVWLGAALGLRLFDRLSPQFIQRLASFIVFLAGLNLLLFS